MKKIAFFMVFMFMAAGMAGAETVYLKSGSSVTGKIVDRSDTSVTMDVGGATVTYYQDEIDRIDETAAPAAASASPAEPASAAASASPAESASAAASASPAESASAAIDAPISKAKHDLILKFIDVFGTRAGMTANFDQMMASLSPEEAGKLRNAFKIDEIIELLVPLYDKYMTESELQAYIDFYTSENGKKLVKVIPQIMRGSVEVSAKYFESHMPEDLKAPAATPAPAGAEAPAPQEQAVK